MSWLPLHEQLSGNTYQTNYGRRQDVIKYILLKVLYFLFLSFVLWFKQKSLFIFQVTLFKKDVVKSLKITLSCNCCIDFCSVPLKLQT